LIERDVKKRLGSSERDAEELRTHPVFAGLDWDAVYHKQIEPEFRPVTVRALSFCCVFYCV
jgi:hypothetical protein